MNGEKSRKVWSFVQIVATMQQLPFISEFDVC